MLIRYEELKEELVEVNRRRQEILTQRKVMNKQMRKLDKKNEELNLEIEKIKKLLN